uniref:Retrotransposon protein, putative, Ty3-gypsy subclass n=1 Tax=Oryza sativa subsp. japonica TaxID=39947 RepID=Q2QU24_ORYSJ|nr:retrotransposon protein, putative, Ty3-gypsy subclass [Oryza sativa Japonica Group]
MHARAARAAAGGDVTADVIVAVCRGPVMIPTFPESPFSQEKNLKSSKASKASHTDPKQPFEHVDPV